MSHFQICGALVSSGAAFDCPSSGVFADPLDCTGYYSCDANLQASKGTCTSSGYYNAALKTCSVGTCTIPTTTVATKTFQCSSSGNFADPKDCRSYYICNYLLESARFTCPLFTYYSTTDNDCEVGDCPAATSLPVTGAPETTPKPTSAPVTKETPTPTSVTPTTSLTTSTTTTPPTTPTNTPLPMCTSSSQTFKYPADCHKYYRCDVNLKLQVQSCGFGLGLQHYDAATGNCSFGILVRSVIAFDCPSFGSFADPLDCRSYYTCNYLLESERFTCPLFTYFSTIDNSCEVGDCPATTPTSTTSTTRTTNDATITEVSTSFQSTIVTSNITHSTSSKSTTTQENPTTTSENPTTTEVNPTTTAENPTTTAENRTEVTNTPTSNPQTTTVITNITTPSTSSMSRTTTTTTTAATEHLTEVTDTPTTLQTTTVITNITTPTTSSISTTPSTTLIPTETVTTTQTSTITSGKSTPTITQTTASTTSVNTGSPSSTTSTTPTCTSSSQTYAYPSDCHKYYSCDSNLKPQVKTCGGGIFLRYDAVSGKCIVGFC
ncbi:hypothetical protein C0J52_25055 [Blattella germanica]|nr:hypothetical protein C0J52_25055 [Blattella germanica]